MRTLPYLLPFVGFLAVAGLSAFPRQSREVLSRFATVGIGVTSLLCLVFLDTEQTRELVPGLRADVLTLFGTALVGTGLALSVLSGAGRGAGTRAWILLGLAAAGACLAVAADDLITLLLAVAAAAFAAERVGGRADGRFAALLWSTAAFGAALLWSSRGRLRFDQLNAEALVAPPSFLIGFSIAFIGLAGLLLLLPLRWWHEAADGPAALLRACCAAPVVQAPVVVGLLRLGQAGSGNPEANTAAFGIALLACVAALVGGVAALAPQDAFRRFAWWTLVTGGVLLMALLIFQRPGASAALFTLVFVQVGGALMALHGSVSPTQEAEDRRASPASLAALVLAGALPPLAPASGRFHVLEAAATQNWWWPVVVAASVSAMQLWVLGTMEGTRSRGAVRLRFVVVFALLILLPTVYAAPLWRLCDLAAGSLRHLPFLGG